MLIPRNHWCKQGCVSFLYILSLHLINSTIISLVLLTWAASCCLQDCFSRYEVITDWNPSHDAGGASFNFNKGLFMARNAVMGVQCEQPWGTPLPRLVEEMWLPVWSVCLFVRNPIIAKFASFMGMILLNTELKWTNISVVWRADEDLLVLNANCWGYRLAGMLPLMCWATRLSKHFIRMGCHRADIGDVLGTY